MALVHLPKTTLVKLLTCGRVHVAASRQLPTYYYLPTYLRPCPRGSVSPTTGAAIHDPSSYPPRSPRSLATSTTSDARPRCVSPVQSRAEISRRDLAPRSRPARSRATSFESAPRPISGVISARSRRDLGAHDARRVARPRRLLSPPRGRALYLRSTRARSGEICPRFMAEMNAEIYRRDERRDRLCALHYSRRW